MKRLGIIAIVGLCALPARGEQVSLTPNVLHAMTPIGSVPSKADIVRIFPQNTVSQLSAIAQDANVDFGVRLRAIRALPQFCLPACAGAPAHQSLVDLLETITDTPASEWTGKTLLLLRATIEAIGNAKSGDTMDVDRIKPFLDNTSRDIRAATAFALRDLCLQSAVTPLRNRYNIEMTALGVPQVRLAISAALRDLNTCGN